MSDSALPPKRWLPRDGVFLLVALAVLTAGVLAAWRSGQQAEVQMQRRLLEQAAGLARTISPDLIKRLTFTAADRTNPAYQRIRQEMISYGQALGLKQIWSDVRRGDQLLFGPENIDSNSSMASVPGTVYEKPSAKNLAVFATQEPAVEGPYTDEFGTFVSAFAPVKDPATGEISLVIGVDILAGDWSQKIWHHRCPPLLLAGAMLLVLFGTRWVWRWRETRSAQLKLRFRQVEAVAILLLGGLLTEAVSQLATERENYARREIFNQLAEAEVAAVRDSLRQIQVTAVMGLHDILTVDGALTTVNFHRQTAHLKGLPGVHLLASVPRVTARERAEFEAVGNDLNLSTNYLVYEAATPTRRAPARSRPDYYPILTLEAEVPERGLIGFDLGSQPAVRAALETALTTHLTTSTPELQLAARPGSDASTLIFSPVFATDKPVIAANFKGFALVELHADELLGDTLANGSENNAVAQVNLLQLSPSEPPVTMATWPRVTGAALPAAALLRAAETSLVVVRPIFAFGQAYALSIAPGTAFLAAHPARDGWLVWACGLLVTVITALFVGVMRNRQEFLEREVATRTETLRATVSRLQLLWQALEQSPASVIIMDAAKRIEYLNPKVVSLTGYASFELLGQLPGVFTSKIMPESFRSALHEQLDAGKIWLGEYCSRTKAGAWFWEAGSILPIKDAAGRITNFLLLMEDVTNRKQAEMALQKSLAQLQATLESTADGILVVDAAGKVLNYNQQFVELWQIPAATLAAHDDQALIDGVLDQLLYPKKFQQRITELYADLRQDSFDVIPLRDGRVFERYTHPQFENGKPVGRVWSFRDVTAQQRAQQQLEQSNDHLEAANARANEMVIKAEMSNIAKSHFLANMSHEIRTPMNGVIGLTGLLLQTELTAEQKQFAHLLKSSGESLLTLINDILDFSKIEAQKLVLEQLDFDLRETLEDATELLAFRAAEKNLRLVCQLPPEVPLQLRGDALRLRQILINLAGNAIKFTAQGQVVLRAELVTQNAATATLKFTVRDSGIGIPLDRQPYLFASFMQVDGSTTRKFGGTGLGLAISKQLTELMGGQIGVVSEPGAGTEFWFSVTLAKANSTAELPPPLPTGRALLLEKHLASQFACRDLLAALGWEIVVAETAAAAENLLKNPPPGLPITLALLAENEVGTLPERLPKTEFPALRLIKLAAFGSRSLPNELAQAGFSSQLNQPFRLAQLAACCQPAATAPPPTATAPLPLAPDLVALRILVVDDNQTNLIVITKILEKLGHQPVAASSGAEALARAQAEIYELILMDCQMPEMDGYETTRRLRAGAAGPQNQTGIIIALTANVQADDQQKCLAAGMNGHLGKPIQIEALQAVLAQAKTKFSAGRAAEKLSTTTTVPPPASPAPAAKLVFNRADMLNRMLDDLEMAALTAEAFLNDLPNQMELLTTAMANGDAPAIAAAAHRMRGATSTIGGDALAQLLEGIETAGKNQEVSAAQELFTRVETEVAALVQALKNEILQPLPA